MLCELFNNAIKHAQASQVNLEVARISGWYVFVVTDNGVGLEQGFDLENNRNRGFGLFNISERLKSLNGNFEIVNQDIGVLAKISIPDSCT